MQHMTFKCTWCQGRKCGSGGQLCYLTSAAVSCLHFLSIIPPHQTNLKKIYYLNANRVLYWLCALVCISILIYLIQFPQHHICVKAQMPQPQQCANVSQLFAANQLCIPIPTLGIPIPTLHPHPHSMSDFPLWLPSVPPLPNFHFATIMPTRANEGIWCTYLWCIIINSQLKVLMMPFWLLLPLDGTCDLFFVHLRIATLLLRNVDHSMFFLYKPHSSIPTKLQVENLEPRQVDLCPSTCVDPTATIWLQFLFIDTRGTTGGVVHDVHAIICIDDTTGTSTSQFYQSRPMFNAFLVNVTTGDLGASRFGPIPIFVIRLKTGEPISHPPNLCVSANNVYVTVEREPEFVHMFQNNLCGHITLSFLGSVRQLCLSWWLTN